MWSASLFIYLSFIAHIGDHVIMLYIVKQIVNVCNSIDFVHVGFSTD